MKKTKHFNISVPELGDVPDITQVSNAISDLEDATAGTLEIMKAEMQGTKITLTSVSRKTKRTGYYEGMSIRFKSPQDIEPNYLKTVSVDGLGDQTLSVAYKVNRNEYIDIVYEGNKFTAYPVVVQKTDSVSNNSSVLVGTAKGVKTAYDKGVEALNKANRAQSTADGKVSKSGDTMTGPLFIDAHNSNVKLLSYGVNKGELVATEGGVALWNATTKNTVKLSDDGSLFADAKNLTTNKKEVTAAINELNANKFDKTGGTINGRTVVVGDVITKNKLSSYPGYLIFDNDSGAVKGGCYVEPDSSVTIKNYTSDSTISLKSNGNAVFKANNLNTQSKEVIGAINELNSGKENKIDKKSGFNLEKTSDYKEADGDKVFTQQGANSLYKEVEKDIKSIDLSGKTDKGGYEGSAQELKELIDGVKTQLNERSDFFRGNTGVEQIQYIQNAGTKEVGQGYFDLQTKKVYICINRTSDTTVTNNFVLATNIENSNNIRKSMFRNTTIKENDNAIVYVYETYSCYYIYLKMKKTVIDNTVIINIANLINFPTHNLNIPFFSVINNLLEHDAIVITNYNFTGFSKGDIFAITDTKDTDYIKVAIIPKL